MKLFSIFAAAFAAGQLLQALCGRDRRSKRWC
jgi:hypothetical protein